MRYSSLCALGILAVSITAAIAADPPEPKFRAVTLDDHVAIGYGIAIGDVDGDGWSDVLLADKKQFVWYRNPGESAPKDGSTPSAGWQKHLLAENLTPQDNVCIAAEDLDGDGKCEIAVGAGWNPSDTVNSGAVFYLIPPADRAQPWQPVKLHAEPTTHRMRWAALPDGKWGLVVVPLHGRGNKNGEGAGVRVLLYHPPEKRDDPKGEWRTEEIDGSMHMTHNFQIAPPGAAGTATGVLIAGKEGLILAPLQKGSGERRVLIGEGVALQSNGIGEVRIGKISPEVGMIATVEPMHGNQLVVYPSGPTAPASRRVLTDKLTEGHALACEDVLGIGRDQVVIGWRGKSPVVEAPAAAASEGGSVPAPGPIGVRLWTPVDEAGDRWRESVIDDGGMACEDLQVADLNKDGRPDIVASGRATRNLKIYFNETPK